MSRPGPHINRDLLGWLRRALKMSGDPVSPDLIGLIQPVVPALIQNVDNIKTFSSTQVAVAAGGVLSFYPFGQTPVDRLKWGYVLACSVSFNVNARSVIAGLTVNQASPAVGPTFFSSGATTRGTHVLVGGAMDQGGPRTLLIPPNIIEASSMAGGTLGNAITLTIGAGATDDNAQLIALLIELEHDDPIPWLPT